MQVNTSIEFEKIAHEFLLLVKRCIRHYYRPNVNEGYQKYDKRELQLMGEFFKIKSEANAALHNTVNTKIAAEKLCQIIDLGEKYINEMKEENKIPNCLLLRNIAAYMISLLKVFGVTPKDVDDICSVDFNETTICGTSPSTYAYELIMPYVSALTVFRETVSELAQQHNVHDIIKECDRIRDEVLPELGILLDEANPEKPVLALKKWSTSAEAITDEFK
uniref:Cysteine--tRNA ligase, cytoplasmic n=1 Tax=Elaeophora elaphi TaxID=1147741 RepID=A0A0R3RZL2_9BILA